MSRAQYLRARPQNVHILPKGHSVKRVCGETTGAFIRERDADALKKFVRDGGGLCPNCERLFQKKESQ
jgi:hypothetical protein